MTGLDLSDPLVRRMAESNHVPRERWHPVFPGRLIGVICDECGLPWRCPTRLALDEMEPDR